MKYTASLQTFEFNPGLNFHSMGAKVYSSHGKGANRSEHVTSMLQVTVIQQTVWIIQYGGQCLFLTNRNKSLGIQQLICRVAFNRVY